MAEKEVRLIDVQQLYNCRTCRHHGHCDFIVTCDHGEMYSPDMSKLETIDPEILRPHGKWVICSDGYYPYCSECKEEPKGGNMTSYCPNCGATMEE